MIPPLAQTDSRYGQMYTLAALRGGVVAARSCYYDLLYLHDPVVIQVT